MSVWPFLFCQNLPSVDKPGWLALDDRVDTGPQIDEFKDPLRVGLLVDVYLVAPVIRAGDCDRSVLDGLFAQVARLLLAVQVAPGLRPLSQRVHALRNPCQLISKLLLERRSNSERIDMVLPSIWVWVVVDDPVRV